MPTELELKTLHAENEQLKTSIKESQHEIDRLEESIEAWMEWVERQRAEIAQLRSELQACHKPTPMVDSGTP